MVKPYVLVKSSGEGFRKKQDMTGCEIAYTGEGGEHQVVNTIYECHV